MNIKKELKSQTYGELEAHLNANLEIDPNYNGGISNIHTNYIDDDNRNNGIIKITSRLVEKNLKQETIKILHYNRFNSTNILTDELHELLEHYEAMATNRTVCDDTSDSMAFKILTEIDTTKQICLYLQSKGVDIEVINEMEKYFLGKNI
ncbi:hypothetical protein [Oceanivirga salmonicida]|uniref:hypothetical protein n=1 Tax=Oceanivirga salmonicida TaxID=1769291 RepID=UPI00083395BE|nr:hypothetical protein [Oceanivirga salmonicida]